MKITFGSLFSIILIACCSLAANAQRQTKLYIDDGSGNFYTLTAPSGGTGGTYTLPSSGLTFPAANAAGVLTNTGSGSLSWTPISGFTPAYFNAYSTSFQVVAPFPIAEVTLDSVAFKAGFTADGFGGFTATAAGIYNVEFSVTPTSASAFAITQNGVILANSQIGCATATTVIHGNAIVSLAVNDKIALVSVFSTVALSAFPPFPPGGATATLTAIRIQ